MVDTIDVADHTHDPHALEVLEPVLQRLSRTLLGAAPDSRASLTQDRVPQIVTDEVVEQPPIIGAALNIDFFIFRNQIGRASCRERV